MVQSAFGALGRAQAKHWYVFTFVGFLVAIIIAGVGNENMGWKTSVVDLWIAKGTRVEKEMSWLDSPEINAKGHFQNEIIVTEMVDENEERTNADAFNGVALKAHQRAMEILMSTKVDFVHERTVAGKTTKQTETYDFNDFARNLYPYAFQPIRVSPLDCFVEVTTLTML
jgi:hypothetical protein